MSEDYIQQCCDKAATFITKGDYDAAEKYLNKALSRQPDHLKVISLLSIVSEGRKKNQKERMLPISVFMYRRRTIGNKATSSSSKWNQRVLYSCSLRIDKLFLGAEKPCRFHKQQGKSVWNSWCREKCQYRGNKKGLSQSTHFYLLSPSLPLNSIPIKTLIPALRMHSSVSLLPLRFSAMRTSVLNTTRIL